MEVLWGFFSNYREVDIKYITPQNDYYQCFLIKHVFLLSFIKIVHKYAIFSESSVPKFVSNKQVFRKIDVLILKVLL